VIEPIFDFFVPLFLLSFGWRSFLALLIAVGLACGLILLRPAGANNLWALGSVVLLIYIAGLWWEYRARRRRKELMR
jgi:hypothetical protein